MLTWAHSFHVLPQLIIIYLMSYIDRTNVGMQALIRTGPLHGAVLGLITEQEMRSYSVPFLICKCPGKIGIPRYPCSLSRMLRAVCKYQPFSHP